MSGARPASIVLTLYVVLTSAITLAWTSGGDFPVTGDEPHYLIITRSLVQFQSLELTDAYLEEFQERNIFSRGLAPKDAIPSSKNTHAVHGPNGLYSVHGVGLPLLLIVPYSLGGILGARLFMIVFSSLMIPFLYHVATRINTAKLATLLSTVGLTCALPFLIAANQLYPDLPAGIISLGAVSTLVNPPTQLRRIERVALSTSLAFLPWLHLRFSLPAIMLVTLLCLAEAKKKTIESVLPWAAPLMFSLLGLAAYHHYAFGNPLGPYHSTAMALNETSIMVFLGLFLDQNQGLLMQNPIHFAGLVAIAPLIRKNSTRVLLSIVVIMTFLVPNAMHTNLFGGASFSGRFMWSAALIFCVLSLYSLSRLFRSSAALFYTILGAGFILQVIHIFNLVTAHIEAPVQALSRRPVGTFPSSYSIFYAPIGEFLPAFYNSKWAFKYGPNAVFALIALAAIAYGFWISRQDTYSSAKRNNKRLLVMGLLVMLSGIYLGGKLPKPTESASSTWDGAELPSKTGHIEGASRVASSPNENPGFLTFGPYVKLDEGIYQVTITYANSASQALEVAKWDINLPEIRETVSSGPLLGTSGQRKKISILFEVNHASRDQIYEFRTHWNGIGKMQVFEIRLDRTSD